MAHINQFIDHVNVQFKKVYKDGVWVKALVTQLAFDERGILIIEGLDISKYEKEKDEARIVFRMLPNEQDDLLIHFASFVNELHEKRFVSIDKGELALYFKVLPALYWKGEFMPLIKDVGLTDLDAKRENISKGLRIGVENAILSLPDNNKKPWTDTDEDRLKRYFVEEGFEIDALAVVLKRTPLSVVDRLIHIGLLKGKKAWAIRNTISGRYD